MKSTMTTPRRPLEGIKILDLTHGVAGPYCTMVLGDLGADVLKIEKPGRGDASRFMNVSTRYTDDIPRTGGDYFLSVNRNKRSVGIDLSKPEGKALIKELAGWADVVAQNFSPGVVQRLGIAYEDLAPLNARLIYANISAYGDDGVLSNRAGMDVAVQARSGVMRITGMPGSTDPLRLGASISDFGGGIYLSTAILAALVDRATTGRGQEVSVSLLDATMSMLANYSVAVMDGAADITPVGSGHPQLVPYQAFPTRDGYVVVGAGTNRTFTAFATLLGRVDLTTDVRFQTNQKRVVHRTALIPILDDLMKQRTTDEWIAALEDANIPCAPVNDLATAFDELHQTSPNMVRTVEHPVIGKLSQIGIPFRFSDCAGELRRPPPLLAEHTEEVLAGILGKSTLDITALRAAGAIG